jgi:hypothetical protein
MGARVLISETWYKATAKAAQDLIQTIYFLSTPPAAENSNGHHSADGAPLNRKGALAECESKTNAKVQRKSAARLGVRCGRGKHSAQSRRGPIQFALPFCDTGPAGSRG